MFGFFQGFFRGKKLMVKVRINLLDMYMFNFTHMHFSSMRLFI